MNKKNIIRNSVIFTHVYVMGFGWEPTVFLPSDFKFIEYVGNGLFVAYNEKHRNGRFIGGDLFKGHFYHEKDSGEPDQPLKL